MTGYLKTLNDVHFYFNEGGGVHIGGGINSSGAIDMHDWISWF